MGALRPQIYDAYFDDFGAGFGYKPAHYEEHSSAGDYSLEYSITVTPPKK
jgi:hypothetical protein